MKKENKDDLVFAILSFLVSFFFYLKTLMPGVGGWGDSARFSFFGKTLGISYPTGYPLYIILDNLFSRLPVGTLSFRTNMMSAFFASLTVAVLYLTIRKLNGNKLLSFVSVLIFAFSGMFWSQSIIAEVYTLNAFFISIMILLLISWSETRDIRLLYLSLFIYGLSFGNHLTMILLFPSIIYLILERTDVYFPI